MKKIISISVFLVLYLLAFAQRANEVPITLETPYNTIYVHLFYLQPDSYRPGLSARTIYGVPDSAIAVRRAIQLKQILDGKGLYVSMNTLPREAGYIDTILNKALYTPFPEALPEVYLEKIENRWYYAEETVALIPALHKKVYPFGADLLLNTLPQFGHAEVLGLALWQYLGLIFLLTLALLVHFILSRVLNPLVRRLTRSRQGYILVGPDLIWKIARLLSVFIIMRIIMMFLPALQLPPKTSSFAILTIKVITTLIIVLIVLRVIDILMLYFDRLTRKTESKLDDQLMPLVKRGVQAVIILAGFVQILRDLHVDITALIAGISIGGLALALAAQDTLKNLFGSLTIFLDRPFQIGDWINFSDVDGTVEEVGFRSTRVRTFANSLVYVPNGKLADMIINNYGLRVYRRFKANISITYDTPPVVIEKFVEGIKAIIENSPDTRKDYYEVHLNEMGAHALDILLYTFFAVPDWSSELKARHQLLLAIMEWAEQLGVRFAFPSTTIYVEEFPGEQHRRPEYEKDRGVLDARLADYMKGFKKSAE